MSINRLLLSVAASLVLASNIFAAPGSVGTSSTISDGASIVITGTGFGSTGPTVLLYDEFEGAVGEDISLTSTVGSWTKYGTYHPIYDSIAHSGNSSMRIYDDSVAQNFRQVKKNFPSAVTEVFISYWVQVPTGTYFPHKTSVPPTLTSFPDESTWKFLWLMRVETGSPGLVGSDNDICLPTHIEEGKFAVAGNTLNYTGLNTYKASEDSWWQWGAWNRMSFHLKADPTNPSTANGVNWTQGVSSAGHHTASSTRPVFGTASAAPPYEWGHIAFLGWAQPTSTAPTRPVYDDLYIATGPNAAARVEIGNNATYSACTKLAISTPTSWADTSVTATVRAGAFSAGDQVYVFVIDANNVPSTGAGPYTFGTGGGGGTRYRARVAAVE